MEALHAFVEGADQDELTMRVRLRSGAHLLTDDTYGVLSHEVHRRIGFSDPGIDDHRNELLWSPERPTLIHAELQLLQGSRVVDEITSYTALRSIGAQREKLVLNGRYYNLRLVLDQGYWPDTLMTAPSGS